ncbi:hypothetical protein [Geomonas sp.]|uniref:hypothetical protein n=1 Tax=Geomonas sp. TaxID=2651584 RepID=UPI002B46F14B|nr:hypothetical protein [Geomonas sp.]HJV36243.1 hypothetical protein [Geomonas sp.]
MKKVTLLIILAGILNVVPAFGADQPPAAGGKNMCALDPMQCPDVVEHMTIQQMIRVLQAEINKGAAVYSSDELRILQNRLNNAKATLNSLEAQH